MARLMAIDYGTVRIGIAVKKIKTFDMFPFTHHIESITILEKK